MKRFFAALLTLLMLLALAPVLPSPTASAEEVTINVYNWG